MPFEDFADKSCEAVQNIDASSTNEYNSEVENAVMESVYETSESKSITTKESPTAVFHQASLPSISDLSPDVSKASDYPLSGAKQLFHTSPHVDANSHNQVVNRNKSIVRNVKKNIDFMVKNVKVRFTQEEIDLLVKIIYSLTNKPLFRREESSHLNEDKDMVDILKLEQAVHTFDLCITNLCF